ncbi:MAG: hypothetical protein AB8G17_07755 [Gammaproteobacteria bacterium]
MKDMKLANESVKALKNRGFVATTSAVPDTASPRQIGARLRRWLASGHVLRPAGEARHDPLGLIKAGYTPRFGVRLFGTDFLLTRLRQEDQFRFFVAYIRLPADRVGPRPVFVRIFYKDSSLVWRCASHYVASDTDQWIGKGAVKPVDGDDELYASAEETTNLPFELQAALDDLSRLGGRARPDHRAIALVLRRGPDGRVEPYADFTKPRDHAIENGEFNDGHPVAWFGHPLRPASLRFASGFTPDLRHGLLDTSTSRSNLYGGDITKYRIVSRNRQIQYCFIAGPRHVWILPPQTLTTELMSYGLRPTDVPCAEDLCLPGYEFHYADSDQDASSVHSQIPHGFAGAPSAIDPSRADVSAWNDRLPVIRAFRQVFGKPLGVRNRVS